MTLSFMNSGLPPQNPPASYVGPAPEVRLGTVFNQQIHAYHPWRYFIAAGESLAKIQEVMDDAHNVQTILNDYARSFGADAFYSLMFKFPDDADVVEVPDQIRYRLPRYHGFASDAGAPDLFRPYNNGALVRELRAARALPAEEREAALQKIAKAVGAVSCDGYAFRFHEGEARERFIADRHYRLASNPAFVRDDKDSGWFKPDPATEEGQLVWQESQRLNYKTYPEHCYSEWLGCNNVNTNPHGHPRFSIDRGRPNETQTAHLENLGGQWIIKVPVIGEGRYGPNGEGGALSGYQERWAVPPGAVPITIAAYFGLLEAAGALSRTPPCNQNAISPPAPQP